MHVKDKGELPVLHKMFKDNFFNFKLHKKLDNCTRALVR